jgi:hypothetical protein
MAIAGQSGLRESPSPQGRAAIVPTQEWIPGKTLKSAVCEKSGSRNGDNGFAGLLEGQSGAVDPLREEIVLGWAQVSVYFHPLEGQKVDSGR